MPLRAECQSTIKCAHYTHKHAQGQDGTHSVTLHQLHECSGEGQKQYNTNVQTTSYVLTTCQGPERQYPHYTSYMNAQEKNGNSTIEVNTQTYRIQLTTCQGSDMVVPTTSLHECSGERWKQYNRNIQTGSQVLRASFMALHHYKVLTVHHCHDHQWLLPSTYG